MKPRLPAPLERHEQARLFEWANLASAGRYPELRLLYAVPNFAVTGRRSGRQAGVVMQRMREGVKPGVPDICLPCASDTFHGLYLELKREKGGRLTLAQRDWALRLVAAGYAWAVCEGWEQARDALLRYLDGQWEQVNPSEA